MMGLSSRPPPPLSLLCPSRVDAELTLVSVRHNQVRHLSDLRRRILHHTAIFCTVSWPPERASALSSLLSVLLAREPISRFVNFNTSLRLFTSGKERTL